MKIENAVSAVFMLENTTAKDLQEAFKRIINLIKKRSVRDNNVIHTFTAASFEEIEKFRNRFILL